MCVDWMCVLKGDLYTSIWPLQTKGKKCLRVLPRKGRNTVFWRLFGECESLTFGVIDWLRSDMWWLWLGWCKLWLRWFGFLLCWERKQEKIWHHLLSYNFDWLKNLPDLFIYQSFLSIFFKFAFKISSTGWFPILFLCDPVNFGRAINKIMYN